MNKSENFNEVMNLVRAGGDVSGEELIDAWSYAEDAYNETYRMAKGLVTGYMAQQETIKRKNAIIEAKIKEIENLKRTIFVLNRKLREATK